MYNGSTVSATFVLDADIGVPVLQCREVRAGLQQLQSSNVQW